MLAAVIFDLYGTLVDNLSESAYTQYIRRMAAMLSAPPEAFRRLWDETQTERIIGRFPRAESNIHHVCQCLGVSPDPAEVKAVVEWRLHFTRGTLIPRPEAEATLAELRERGLKIGLISDGPWEVPRVWGETVLARMIDVAVFSCEARLTKPDRAIYELACARLGTTPSACLFVGDGGSKELTGAVSAGLQALLIRPEYETSEATRRLNSETWSGPRITDLGDVLGFAG